MTDYHHTKCGLIWSKESKVTEGGGIPPPQVENVLNRPGEIGLSEYSYRCMCSEVVIFSVHEYFKKPYDIARLIF